DAASTAEFAETAEKILSFCSAEVLSSLPHRRERRPTAEALQVNLCVFCALCGCFLCALCLLCGLPAGAARPRCAASPSAAAACGGAGRSGRVVGVARVRRLALAHGHAAEGRRPVPSGERRRPARGGGVGSRERQGGRRAVPRLWRRRVDAPAGAASYQ